MSVTQILLFIFTMVGIIFLLAIVWYFLTRFWQTERKKARQQDWPPENYMKTVGAQCPDYWVYEGRSGNNVICRNKFNLPVKQDTTSTCADVKCYDENDTKQFANINRWPLSPNNWRIKQRCKWRNCCNFGNNVPASWVGIDQYC